MENTPKNSFEEALTTGRPQKTIMNDGTKALNLERLLNVLSYINLFIGGISFILSFILAGLPQGHYNDLFDDFNWVIFVIGIDIAFTQIVIFAILQALRIILIKLNK